MFSGSNEETDFAISSISFFCLVARFMPTAYAIFYSHLPDSALSLSTRVCTQSIYQSLHSVRLMCQPIPVSRGKFSRKSTTQLPSRSHRHPSLSRLLP